MDDHFVQLEDTQFEVMRIADYYNYYKDETVYTYILRVAGKVVGAIDEPTIQAAKSKMLERLL